ncbi:MAG: hypothetical protein IJX23_03805 [Clostridia bacterium]|nr:hypothetical protein [Clostridia bacterium]
MNKSDTPTKYKIPIPLRLSPELYDKLVEAVQKKKRSERGYSINQYITEVLEAELKERKHV